MENTARNDVLHNSKWMIPNIQDAIPTSIDFGLDVSNPDYLIFQNENIVIEVIGGVQDEFLSTLKVAIKVYKVGTTSPAHIYRNSLVNLFDENQVAYTITKASERLKLNPVDSKIASMNL